jgi:hypothetical protein
MREWRYSSTHFFNLVTRWKLSASPLAALPPGKGAPGSGRVGPQTGLDTVEKIKTLAHA